MEKNHYCVICKYYGIFHDENTNLDHALLYDEKGDAIHIMLCRKYSVELFKRGQRRFLITHHKILNDLMISDDEKFLEILHKTVKKNYHTIF